MPNKQVMSFEIFPPKRESSADTVYAAIDGLAPLNPDFISVTYGAGGGGNSAYTIDMATKIQESHGIPAVAHIPGLTLSKDDARCLLDTLKDRGISRVLALRGDITPDTSPAGDFNYASDLCSFIKNEYGDYFKIYGACYPETHTQAKSAADDIINLRTKVDSGASHLITQLFFDNAHFYNFYERALNAGVEVPIEAGIMPVVNVRQIERMVALCGASLPRKFSRMMARYAENPQAVRDAGIAYAIDQITDLLSNGVYGIHVYTMNDPDIAARIYGAVKSLFEVGDRK